MVRSDGKWKQSTAPRPRTARTMDRTPLIHPEPKRRTVSDPDIASRPEAGDSGDERFRAREEPEGGERSIAPPGGDAVVRDVGRGVVLLVRGAAQDAPAGLELADQKRRLAHVCPLVDLVGGETTGAEGDEEACPRLAPVRAQRESKGEEKQRRLDHGHVAVRVDEVPLEEVIGVVVVDTEGADEPATQDRRRLAPPGIGGPVDETGP